MVKMLFPRFYLILRGGLGNQLNQISALSKIIDMNGGRGRIFSHIVDHAIDETRRGHWREVFKEGMFTNINIREVNHFEEIFIRLIRKFPSIFEKMCINEANYFEVHNKKIYYIQDYFDKKKFCTDKLNLSVIKNKQFVKNQKRSIKMHVRLTDYIGLDEFQPTVDFYLRAIEYIKLGKNEKIDCFTDDIEAVKLMFGNLINEKNIEFPEQAHKFSPIEVLKNLAMSDVLICSRSSLCWWAALKVNQNGGMVLSPWGPEKNLESFIQITKNGFVL